jgi:hypothetical protein
MSDFYVVSMGKSDVVGSFPRALVEVHTVSDKELPKFVAKMTNPAMLIISAEKCIPTAHEGVMAELLQEKLLYRQIVTRMMNRMLEGRELQNRQFEVAAVMQSRREDAKRIASERVANGWRKTSKGWIRPGETQPEEGGLW